MSNYDMSSLNKTNNDLLWILVVSQDGKTLYGIVLQNPNYMYVHSF